MPGPGRPKGGQKFGGRQKGTKNKATREREQRMTERLITEHLSPDDVASMTAVEVLCRILRAEVLEGDRAAAKATAAILAPYQSAKLSSSDMRITNADAAKSDAELAAELAALHEKMIAAKVLN